MDELQPQTGASGTPHLGRIAVLCGGPSGERDVSLQSGQAVTRALAGAGCDVFRLVVEDAADATVRLDRALLDVAFLALHGPFGEDGGIQKLLEARGIPYTGSGPLPSRICMDKAATKCVLKAFGIPTPPHVIVGRTRACRARKQIAAAGLVFPVVVKPNRAGSSLGVAIVPEPRALAAALAGAFVHDDLAMVEAFVAGRELTVGIVGGRVLPVIELITDRDFYDYHAKYLDDATRYLCPAPISPATCEAVQRMALRSAQALRVRDLARVDILMPDEAAGTGARDGPQVIEINTIPGFTSHSLLPKAAGEAGISFGDLCRRLVSMAVRRREAPAASRDTHALRRAG